MNIEKLEKILQEMRSAHFTDLAVAGAQVETWADQIAAAITEHLISSLDSSLAVSGMSDLSSQPGGHDWDDPDSDS